MGTPCQAVPPPFCWACHRFHLGSHGWGPIISGCWASKWPTCTPPLWTGGLCLLPLGAQGFCLASRGGVHSLRGGDLHSRPPPPSLEVLQPAPCGGSGCPLLEARRRGGIPHLHSRRAFQSSGSEMGLTAGGARCPLGLPSPPGPRDRGQQRPPPACQGAGLRAGQRRATQ